MSSHTITLSAVGLSAQEGTVVNVAANLLAALDYTFKVLDAGDTSAEILLINPTSAEGRGALAALSSGQRAVLIVDNDEAGRGHPSVVRPLRVQTLLDALTEQVAYVRPPTAVAASAAQQAPAAQPKAAATAVGSAAPSGPMPVTLFYLLINAVIGRTLVRVQCSHGTVLLIHGPSKCVYTQADSVSLEKLAQQSGEALVAQKMGESDFMHAAKGMPLTRLHDVIWLAERYGARGQLLPGHSLDIPVRLKVWPKFNNRHVQPANLKLAALLSKHPITLRALAASSDVPLSQVIDFYNASVAFEVIEKQESAPQITPPKSAKSGGLLSRIAMRLAMKRE